MNNDNSRICPDCDGDGFDRRDFLRTVATTTTAAVLGGSTLWAVPRIVAAPSAKSTAETVVKTLYDTLTDAQKKDVCFDWDYKHPERGLLRTHISNFWAITKHPLNSKFYTKDQQALLFDIFKGLFNPDWHEKFVKQLKDDHGKKPWGAGLSCALFGTPGTGKFQFVMTGRHMTVRADGDSENRVALGGPIFHGHAPEAYTEKVHHPGNIFWHQAELANKVYTILDGKQQQQALAPRLPAETSVGFRDPKAKMPGLPCSEMSKDQKAGVEKVLMSLIEPYRKEDREKVQECLKKMGGLDKCSLTFYKEGDLGDDGEWDNWRLEGPAFVWYFRGSPHVHIWINVAADPTLPLNSKNF